MSKVSHLYATNCKVDVYYIFVTIAVEALTPSTVPVVRLYDNLNDTPQHFSKVGAPNESAFQ